MYVMMCVKASTTTIVSKNLLMSKEEEGAESNVATMRKLLSSYYGIDKEEDVKSKQQDLDSADFDADAFAVNLLRNERLSSLLKKDNELVHAVRAISSERKMLVHENYNKFISATDTIRQMKQKVEDMEEKIRELIDDMDDICESSKVITETLAPRRSEIEKLVGVRGLLKKLEFLFELPIRLNRCIELEAYVVLSSPSSSLLLKHTYPPFTYTHTDTHKL